MRGETCRAALLLALALGCGASRAGDRLGPARSGASPGDLLGAHDRARLEALAAERTSPAAEEGYRIGPDDLLDVRIPELLEAHAAAPAVRPGPAGAGMPTVAEAPIFQQGLRVDASGQVVIPTLGRIPAAGRTPGSLADEIARRLVAAGVLRNPQVSVLVAEHRSRVVAVIGSVERPGLYPLTRPAATLADLVWSAGGPSKEAGRVVEFVPAGTRREAPIRLDLELLLHATGQEAPLNPQVRAGDVVSLSPAGSVHVDGWVDKPGSYPVTRGLTLSGAIAAAGGHLFPADRRHATVKRVLGPGEERLITVDLEEVARGRTGDIPVVDGDVVRVPPAPARLLPWGVWTLAREMVHVGGSVLLF
jgi:polysaccharide export outer membrane protein